ncbi:unnamed protein product [Strongylus vulgaris]|uniref:glucuronosyltransferase n=1 Tax=Strongylus vulgaris TaxID=40348 RepID=A0A3P7JH55_STRVU|nr:unnamed protein product [Strongylus vulgaris]
MPSGYSKYRGRDLTAFTFNPLARFGDEFKPLLLFNERVAEELAEAGHDVTIILISPQSDRDNSDIKISKKVKAYVVNATIGLSRKEMEEEQKETVFGELSGLRMMKRFSRQISLITDTCRATLEHKELIGWLKSQKFDLAFAHMFDVCPIGLIHAAQIPSIENMDHYSATVVDYVAYITGIPTIPSYVPPVFMNAVGEMNFIQRAKSLIGHGLIKFLWKRWIVEPEMDLFRTYISPDFPDILELAGKCPLVIQSIPHS